MSDNIDYDELDKAVTQAIKANAPKKVASVKPAAKTPVTPKTSTKRRYMDFVAAPKHHITTTKPVVKNTTPTPAPKPAAKPRRIAKITSTNSVMPKLRPAASTRAAQLATQRAIASKNNAKAPEKPAVKTEKPVAKPAPKTPVIAKAAPVKKNPVPRGAATADPANLPGAVQPRRSTAKSEDTAENYSIGGHSPFVTTKVEKRPLGNNIPDATKDLESTKNTYSSKNPLKKRRNDKHVVVEDDVKKHSGWLWTILVLIIIAAGGGLGYLAYLIVFAN